MAHNRTLVPHSPSPGIDMSGICLCAHTEVREGHGARSVTRKLWQYSCLHPSITTVLQLQMWETTPNIWHRFLGSKTQPVSFYRETSYPPSHLSSPSKRHFKAQDFNFFILYANTSPPTHTHTDFQSYPSPTHRLTGCLISWYLLDSSIMNVPPSPHCGKDSFPMQMGNFIHMQRRKPIFHQT